MRSFDLKLYGLYFMHVIFLAFEVRSAEVD